MKKFALLLLFLIFSMCLLASCGGENASRDAKSTKASSSELSNSISELATAPDNLIGWDTTQN